ncbi:MAG: hypothetical protein ACLQFR_31650 [Streptosporangiaceae bacterium]
MADIRSRYEDVIDELMGVDGVTPPPGGSGFGRGALRYQGKIFAMLVRGRFVVKLPADRVTALIDSDDGAAFDANKGTPMREWLSLDPESSLDWLSLAHEALDFARARARQPR